ncbi:MAG TPA: response regulator [Pyrinomonadaceae bacterium]
MVVDDNPTLRELITVLLQSSGYNVVEAEDGREAVRLVRSGCPDLILMDIQMPGMDGLDATRMIRSIRELCRMPIVAFSAYGEGEENRRAALAAGCTDYVSKTMGITELPAIVERYLKAV